MATKNLIINIGSASKKYAIYDDLDQVVFFYFEMEKDKPVLIVKTNDKFEKSILSQSEYDASLEYLLDYSGERLGINSSDIFILGFRIVAPGNYFSKDRELDEAYFKKLNKAKELDELHIEPVLKEIKTARNIFKTQKFIAVSDSSFHSTKLEESKYYGLSKEIQDQNDYKRFGYHGISAQSIVGKIKQKEVKIYERTIVCHIGGGVSITALLNGKSLDNTMGFSPLEGPIMSTRSGDVDEILLLDLYKKNKIRAKRKILDTLYLNSGLKGLSGISDDLRVIRDSAFKGEANAKIAIKTYVYNILKKTHEMIGVTKGVDCIVFTGAIGFRADYIRELILDELRWLGIDYDLDRNTSNNLDSGYFHIETPNSKVKIIVIETDEMKQIAKNTLLCS